jgi:hypothetical protein
MTARVAAANHLGHLLVDGGARKEVADHTDIAQRMSQWRAGLAKARLADPSAQSRGPERLTDFQTGFYDMARRLREPGLPGAHP